MSSIIVEKYLIIIAECINNLTNSARDINENLSEIKCELKKLNDTLAQKLDHVPNDGKELPQEKE